VYVLLIGTDISDYLECCFDLQRHFCTCAQSRHVW